MVSPCLATVVFSRALNIHYCSALAGLVFAMRVVLLPTDMVATIEPGVVGKVV